MESVVRVNVRELCIIFRNKLKWLIDLSDLSSNPYCYYKFRTFEKSKDKMALTSGK